MIRLAVRLVLTLALLAMGYAMGHHVATPAPTDVIGTYATPTGELTVYGDTSGQYVPWVEPSTTEPMPMPTYPLSMGACAIDDTDATTGAPSADPVYLCAPSVAPDGYLVGYVDSSDGTGIYPGSAWQYDGQAYMFVPAEPDYALPSLATA